MYFCLKSVYVTLLVLAIGCFWSGQVQAASYKEENTPWVMAVQAGEEQWVADNAQARVVVFRLQRPNDNYGLMPLNVFVNDSYHASLYPEHQAVGLSLCPGKSTMQITPGTRTSGQSPADIVGTFLTPQLQAGITYFYQIAIDNQGKTLGRWVNADQAREVLSSIDIQTHTVSRVNEVNKCPASIYTIGAPALFHLARYDEQGLIPGAEVKLAELSSDINKNYKMISRVVIKGYADPVGTAKNNMLLSEQRAKTIAEKLLSAGLSTTNISVEGLGSSSLVVSGCERLKTRQAVSDCNQPNRRVEVEVYGIKWR